MMIVQHKNKKEEEAFSPSKGCCILVMSAELIFVNEVIICQKMGSWRKLPELIDTGRCSLSSRGQPIIYLLYCSHRWFLWRVFFFSFCIRCYIKKVERALDNIDFVLCVCVRACAHVCVRQNAALGEQHYGHTHTQNSDMFFFFFQN